GATGKAHAWPFDIVALPPRPIWRAHRMIRRVAHIYGDKALATRRRQEEMRVLHAERTGDARLDEFVERHARRALHHAAENVGVVAVYALRPVLRADRKRRELVHARANRLSLVGGVPSPPGVQTEARGGVS